MTDVNIAQQRRWLEEQRASEALMHAVAGQCAQLAEAELPPSSMMSLIGSHDGQHYKDTMIAFFMEITRRCHVHPGSHLLDLGCGCGRLAMPFCRFLKDGKYYGFDVWAEGIGWCRDNIAAKSPNASFHTVEAKDNYYFAARSGEANAFRMDAVPSRSIDVAFGISVFSHLVRDDCRSYFREFGRVLKKDGLAYVTSFVVDRYFQSYVAQTGEFVAVREQEPGCYYAYEGQDFFAGYSYAVWRGMIEAAGLEIISFEPGCWARKPGGRMYQDTFIAIKS